jgi:hypothetical protein
MTSRIWVLLFAGCLLVGPLTVSTLATSEYGLSAEPSIDVPDRTVTYDGNEYTFNAITQTTTDSAVEVTTTVPNDESYYIQFRDPDNGVIESVFQTGESSYSIDFYGEGQAGTYAVLLRESGEFRAIYPIIVPGYDVSVSAPETVDSDSSITVTADISERSIDRHSDLSYVELVLYNDGHEMREQMEAGESGSYTQTVSADQLDTGTYSVSVVVRGDAEVRNQDEVLALSEPRSLTVTETDTQTPTETDTPASTPADDDDSSGGGGGSSGGGGGSAPPDTDDEEIQTERETQTITATTPTTTQTIVPTTTVEPATPTSTPSEQPSVTEDPTQANAQTPTVTGVLEPNTEQPTSANGSTSSGSGPGFTPLLTVFAAISAIVYMRMR